MRIASSGVLCGVCLLVITAAASAQVPVPAPRPKTGIVPPPAAQPQPAQSNSGFPFRIPGFSKPDNTGNFDAKQRQLVERMNLYLMNLQTLVGDFVQVGADGRRVDGKIYLQKPGRVKFEYNPPSPIELVSDGNSVVVRDRKLETQDLYPLSQTPLRFLLSDRIDLLRDSNVVAVASDDQFATVQIEEKQTLGGTHTVRLMFGAKDMQLKQWTITDPQGYDTTVALSNLDYSQKLDAGMFRIDYARKEIIQ